MHADYYQNTLYPLQDKILNVIAPLPVEFYLTGGTALSRAYLQHRYSDDLDFFVNGALNFKQQVNTVINELKASGVQFNTAIADDGFARLFVFDGGCALKIDFVNDIPYRSGTPSNSSVFIRTDNVLNILSNKLSALSRYAPKDVIDIVYICGSTAFNWTSIFNDASEKDIWINPVNAAEILEQFPMERMQEISWINEPPSNEWLINRLNQIIPDILEGKDNSLYG